MKSKTYIDLSDIRGIRVECSKCHIAVEVGLDFAEKQSNFLFQCPGACGESQAWTDRVAGSDRFKSNIKEFIKDLKEAVQKDERFSIALVIDKELGA